MPRRQTIITGKSLNDLWNVGAKHALYREDGKWYHHLEGFPGALFDSNGYVVFQTEQDYRDNPYLQLKQDLHIIGGISSLPGYIRISEKNQFKAFSQNLQQTIEKAPLYSDRSLEIDLLKAADLPEKIYEATRKSTMIQRIIRDTEIARRVKLIHDFRCQICGYTLDLGNGKLYAEAHHIKPLGSEHKGPDIVENIMCVCPNHHALLDYRAIPIDPHELRRTSGHLLSEIYIDYHNTQIFKQGATVPIHR
jgi:5-methylcytosine-specific restriction protein A